MEAVRDLRHSKSPEKLITQFLMSNFGEISSPLIWHRKCVQSGHPISAQRPAAGGRLQQQAGSGGGQRARQAFLAPVSAGLGVVSDSSAVVSCLPGEAGWPALEKFGRRVSAASSTMDNDKLFHVSG